MTGNDRVVLGDLVYSKGSSHEKSVEVINAEPEEDSSSDGIDYSSITELSETELFEEKVKSVKVRYSFFVSYKGGCSLCIPCR